MQDWLVPPLHPEEASGIISDSEQILKNYANKVSLNANNLKILIEDVFHNPNFNAEDVDTDHNCFFHAACALLDRWKTRPLI